MKRILYHANCFDGLGAAWAARQRPEWRDAECIPVNYDQPPPTITGDDVLIVDFSYPRDVLIAMRAAARSLHVYDHHKTAEEALRGLDFCTFDMNRSGAGLVWDEMIGGPRPLAVDYIEDRDLWRHALPFAPYVQAWMRSFPTTYASVDSFVNEMAGGVADEAGGPFGFVREGAALMRFRREIIETAAKDAAPVKIDGQEGRAVNFGTNELYSEVAEEIGHGHAFGVAYRVTGDGRVLLSFRSGADAADVSIIARSFGGGGHAHAAGAYVTRDVLLGLLDSANMAFSRGGQNCAMDANENAPFASIGGLTARAAPVVPGYEWLRTDEDRALFLRGYLWQAQRMYGPDWRTCEFSWRHAFTPPQEVSP